jgi:hypothetical protein
MNVKLERLSLLSGFPETPHILNHGFLMCPPNQLALYGGMTSHIEIYQFAYELAQKQVAAQRLAPQGTFDPGRN